MGNTSSLTPIFVSMYLLVISWEKCFIKTSLLDFSTLKKIIIVTVIKNNNNCYNNKKEW